MTPPAMALSGVAPMRVSRSEPCDTDSGRCLRDLSFGLRAIVSPPLPQSWPPPDAHNRCAPMSKRRCSSDVPFFLYPVGGPFESEVTRGEVQNPIGGGGGRRVAIWGVKSWISSLSSKAGSRDLLARSPLLALSTDFGLASCRRNPIPGTPPTPTKQTQ